MVLSRCFNLVLHYGETIAKIVNVDPDQYSYLDLRNDVLNALVKIDASVRVPFEIEFEIWSESKRSRCMKYV